MAEHRPPDQPYRFFDADNHYYETRDCFTRFSDPGLRDRAIRVEPDERGRDQIWIGDKPFTFLANHSFERTVRPGALREMLKLKHVADAAGQVTEAIQPEYRERAARLALMDRQGLESCLLFPTLAVCVEHFMKHDPVQLYANLHAFNRWLEEDWGFAYKDRIFAAPYISLADVNWAVKELDWILDHGARVFCIRPSAVLTANGYLSPGDPYFDPFWARVNEAGISVVIHAGDSGYSAHGYDVDGFSASFGEGDQGNKKRPSIKMWNIERAALDFLATMIFDRVFERFPNVRVASVENGSEFLPDLIRKLGSMRRKNPGYFQQDPVETFRNHVWINPFWEDDVNEVVEHMGADQVIFGSDWPHIEGLPSPLDYLADLTAFNDRDRRKILRDNALSLTEFTPA
jgi:predicted TIM-barrel fold metal-dependent hydrolase